MRDRNGKVAAAQLAPGLIFLARRPYAAYHNICSKAGKERCKDLHLMARPTATTISHPSIAEAGSKKPLTTAGHAQIKNEMINYQHQGVGRPLPELYPFAGRCESK